MLRGVVSFIDADHEQAYGLMHVGGSIFRRIPVSALLILAAAGFILMVRFERGVQTDCGHVSQLQLQFAWSGERARTTVLECWGASGTRAVVAGIRADFLFLSAYAPLLAILVHRVRTWRERIGGAPTRRSAARWLVWAQLLAGLLDAIENLLMLGIIDGRLDAGVAFLVGLVATLKFALILAGILYLLSALPVWYRRRQAR